MYALIQKLFAYRQIRYLFAGSIGASVHVGTVFVLTHLFSQWYLYATFIGFLLAFGVSFTLQKFFTFQNDELKTIPVQSSIFFAISATNFFVNGFLMYSFVEKVGLWPAFAQIISSLIVAVWSYVAYAWLFKRRATPEVV